MSFVTTPKASKIPTPVIVSTDYSEDADDVLDIRALATAHHRGMINLLGVVVDNRTTGGMDNVSAVDAHLIHDGLPGLPLGVASVPNSGTRPSTYVDDINTTFPGGRSTASVPSAATVLRTLLAARPGRDVTLLGLGFFGAWHDLMLSGADGISPLTGIQLIEQKVKRAVIMAGKYPTDLTFVEYNFAQGPAASTRHFIDNWPPTVPITWLGYETSINNVGAPVLDGRAGDLVQVGLTAAGYGSGKIAWPASVLVAVNGDAAAAGFTATRGTVTYNVGMNSIFTEGPSVHEYASIPQEYAQLTATASAGNTTLSINKKLPAGAYRLGTTATGENIIISDVTGSASPFTATLAAAITGATYAANSHIVGDSPTSVAQIKTAFEDLLVRRSPVVVDENLWTPALAQRPPDAWWRAEDLSGLGPGAPVSSWTDTSGAGRVLTQATANFRPVLQQDSAGRWLVRFDGANDRLDNADPAILNTVGFTLWIVAAFNSAAAGSQCLAAAHFSASAHTTPFFRWSVIRNGANFGGFSRIGATKTNPDPVALPGGSTTLTGWDAINVYEVCPGADGSASGDPMVIRRNGTPVAWQPPGNAQTTTTAAVIRIGGLGDGTWPFNGDVYEVLLWGNNQTAADRRRVRAWLRKKYQTT